MRLFIALSVILAITKSAIPDQPVRYSLPELLLFIVNEASNQPYLLSGKQLELSCQIAAGFSTAKLDKVIWLKDGKVIGEEDRNYTRTEHSLTIIGAKNYLEGEYQCQGDVIGISFKGRNPIDTVLISAPTFLRKARLAKFITNKADVIVTVHEGEIARLPCVDQPDVLPGPPDINFFYENVTMRGLQFIGDITNFTNGIDRFLSTPTGMQIYPVRKEDEGRYVCDVRNDFLNKSRRSDAAVLLEVIASKGENDTKAINEMYLEWPQKQTSLDRPIQINAVQSSEVVLECVVRFADIRWEKVNNPFHISTEPSDRISQLWGNLRVTNVSKGDAGMYKCIAKPNALPGDDSDSTEITIFYELVVHLETIAVLHLSRRSSDDLGWQISCLGKNLQYEIPMVYVNATPLIDAVELMGVARETNFYANPINLTIVPTAPFTGSIQCISRPAMEEAEIYGKGLERGRANNFYLSGYAPGNTRNIIRGPSNTTGIEGGKVKLECETQKTQKRSWKKGNKIMAYSEHNKHSLFNGQLNFFNLSISDEGWYSCIDSNDHGAYEEAKAYLSVVSKASLDFSNATTTEPALEYKKNRKRAKITKVTTIVFGNTVRITWTLDGDPEESIAKFLVQSQKKGESGWKDHDRPPSHLKAWTVANLTPKKEYKFRVGAVYHDQATDMGPDTDWVMINYPTDPGVPDPPVKVTAEAVSSNSVRARWTHKLSHANLAPKTFIVSHAKSGSKAFTNSTVSANRSSLLISGLTSNTSYVVMVYAANDAGTSLEGCQSDIVITKTTEDDTSLTSLFVAGFMDLIEPLTGMGILVVVGISIVVLILVIICCFTCCACKRKRRHLRSSRDVNDPSYHIFNELKIGKYSNRPTMDYNAEHGIYPRGVEDDDDIPVPVRGGTFGKADNLSLNSRKSFLYRGNGMLPNLYGGVHGDDDSDGEGETDPLAPLDAHYGMMMGNNGGSQYAASTTTSRMFQPDKGTYREVVPPLPPLLSTGGMPYKPACSSPPLPIPPLLGPNCSPHKLPATVAYKGGEPSVLLTYSPASRADSGGSGSEKTRTTAADSPTHPLTDGSENGGHHDDSSRNSQVSSSDGRFTGLHTFKGSAPGTPMMTTFMVPR